MEGIAHNPEFSVRTRQINGLLKRAIGGMHSYTCIFIAKVLKGDEIDLHQNAFLHTYILQESYGNGAYKSVAIITCDARMAEVQNLLAEHSATEVVQFSVSELQKAIR